MKNNNNNINSIQCIGTFLSHAAHLRGQILQAEVTHNRDFFFPFSAWYRDSILVESPTFDKLSVLNYSTVK